MAAKEFLTNILIGGKVDPTLQKALKASEKALGSSKKKIDAIGNAMKTATIAMGAAAASGMAYSVKTAIDYETTLAKVATIADTSKVSMEELSAQALKVSNDTGVAAGEINEAMYNAISAGADTAKASGLVETAVKAAKGGFTDTTTAVDGLTTVLNAYGMATEDAEKIANQMMVTQNLGKTTFGELAQSVGKLAPITKAANVGTEEMFSSLAVLTANGIQTSEAVSGMKAAISNVIKPTAAASKMAESLGLDFSSAALESKGLAGFLQDVQDKTGGNLDTMSALFGSVEGLNAVLSLTSEDGMAKLNSTMDAMGSSAGALEDAFNTMAGTPAERLAVLQNKVSNLAIRIGQELLPIAETVMQKAESIDFDAIFAGIHNGFQWIMDNKDTIVACALAIAAGMVAWNVVTIVQGVIAAIKAWQLATEGMTIAQRLLNLVMMANPIGIVIAAVAGLVAGLVYLHAKGVTVSQFFEGFFGILGKVGNAIKGVAQGIGKVLGFAGKSATVTAETKNITAYATGGTLTSPELAVVGDAPETIVPHGNSPRNRGLLAEAAAGVGANIGGTVVNISFAPTVQGGSKEDTKQALRESEEEFERKMDAYFKRKGRLSFA